MSVQWKSQLAIATLGAGLALSLGACDGALTGPQGQSVLEGQVVRDDEGFEFGTLDGLQRLEDFGELEKKDEEGTGPEESTTE